MRRREPPRLLADAWRAARTIRRQQRDMDILIRSLAGLAAGRDEMATICGRPVLGEMGQGGRQR